MISAMIILFPIGPLTQYATLPAADSATDEPDALRLPSIKDARRQRELARNAVVTDDLGEALQRANVGRKSHVHLLFPVSRQGGEKAERESISDPMTGAM